MADLTAIPHVSTHLLLLTRMPLNYGSIQYFEDLQGLADYLYYKPAAASTLNYGHPRCQSILRLLPAVKSFIASGNSSFLTCQWFPASAPITGTSDESVGTACAAYRLVRGPNHKDKLLTMNESLIEERETNYLVRSSAGHFHIFSGRTSDCYPQSLIHSPWQQRNLRFPRQCKMLPPHMSKRIRQGIIEFLQGPDRRSYFLRSKKTPGACRFINDVQPLNKVTIRDYGMLPAVDELSEGFAGYPITCTIDHFSLIKVPATSLPSSPLSGSCSNDATTSRMD